VHLGSEFTGESERTATSGIIKLSAIRDVVNKVICTETLVILLPEDFVMACVQ